MIIFLLRPRVRMAICFLLFPVSILVFAFIYMNIYSYSGKDILKDNGSNYVGFFPTKRSFLFSEQFDINQRVKSIRSLRLTHNENAAIKTDQNTFLSTSRINASNPQVRTVAWEYFIEKLVPSYKYALSDLNISLISDKTAIELIENDFLQHGDAVLQLDPNRANFTRWPFLSEDIPKAIMVDGKISRKKEIISALNFLQENHLDKKLSDLSMILTFNSKELSNYEKELFYSYFLYLIAFNTQVDLSQIIFEPEFSDFLYFSFVTGTTTGYGDILPNDSQSRNIVMVQIFITYILLGLILYSLTSIRSK